MSRVTVVTAAYNAAPYIAETIESVLAQTFADFDYIVVDDGSTDCTHEIASRYSPRLVVLRQENAGAGAARNLGFELASGEYVAIVDADDVWEADKLARQVDAMDADADAGLCYTNAREVGADGSVLMQRMVAPHRSLTCLMAMTGGNPIVTSTIMYRRRFLESRPFLRTLPPAEDFHVHLKTLWRSNERAIFIDVPLVRYRVVGTSVLRRIDARERGRAGLRAVESFIDDMREEKPVPEELQRRGTAHAHFMWAWFCIDAGVADATAVRQLCHAVIDDWGLAPRAVRQLVKLAAKRTGFGPDPRA